MHANQPEKMKLQAPRETAALRTYFADVDKAAGGAIGERFGKFVSPERRKALPDLPSKFEGERELRKSYREETGRKAPNGLAGFTKPDSPAHISVAEMTNVPEVVLHERLHQLASPDAKRVLGDKLYEGMTQDLAIEVLGQEPQPEDLTGYPAERAQAHGLRNLVGSEAVYRAYFQGDAQPLRAAIDKALAEKPLAG
ncbi:MAG: hypothetical protein P4L87_23225, partial [Formivibrio sp.]|nr:hypothetical protein [Formivibrio sp.]